MSILSTLTLAAAFAFGAASATVANAAEPVNQASRTVSSKSEGEIKKIDRQAGKITIQHGELKNLHMGPMTMVFRVGDSPLPAHIKAGDKIRFVDGKAGAQFTATQIEVKR